MSKRLTLPQLKQALTDKVASSAIEPSKAKKLKLEVVPDVSKLPGMQKFPAMGGFRLPYFSLAGTELPKVCRVRYLEDTRTGFTALTDAKAMRYVQAPDTPVHCYFPPLVNWKGVVSDAEQPLFITEGELKAACATAHGYPCVGLGGVWSFRSNKLGTSLIEDFAAFKWDGRAVYICYDSDAVSNPLVMQAEVALADRLTELGAQVYIVRLAVPPGTETDATKKIGLDDLVAAHGIEAFEACLVVNEGEGEVRGAYPYSRSHSLHRFNTKYVFILQNNAVYDVDNHLTHQASAFTNSICANIYYDALTTVFNAKTGTADQRVVRKPLAPAWVKWPGRSSVKSLTFEPGQPFIYERMLNTWRGWNFDRPEKGDVTYWKRLLDRVFFKARPEDRLWFERWAAYPIRHPGVKMNCGVLIWGHQHGTGKSLIGAVLSAMYHPDHTTTLTESAFDDQRNQWAMDKQFVVADDITGKESREHANRLKNLVTQPKIQIDPKYIGAYDLRDCIAYYITANDSDALLLNGYDRRFFVHGVIGEERMDPAFGDEIMAWIGTPEGRRALYYYFLHLDLGDFNPKAPAPVTDAKATMIETTRTDIGNWVSQLKEFPELTLDAAKFGGDIYTAEKLYALFDPSGEKKSSPRALTKELQSQGFRRAAAAGLVVPGEGRRHAYVVRNVVKWEDADAKKLVAEYLRGNPQLLTKTKKY